MKEEGEDVAYTFSVEVGDNGRLFTAFAFTG